MAELIFGGRRLPRRIITLSLIVAGLAVILLSLATAVRAQQMVASWYGPGFEGADTASGEPFDPGAFTAAHKTLPFGTKLIVTYNGKSAVVEVNDRGPYVAGRDIDLSQAAAEYLGISAVGHATVEVSQADASTPVGPYSGEGGSEPAPEPEPQPSQQSEPVTQQAAEPVVQQAAEPVGGAEEAQYEGNATAQYDQYEGNATAQYEQYTEPAAITAPEPDPEPVTTQAVEDPAPAPQELQAPPEELADPGSTVEKRIQIGLAAAPTKQPEVENEGAQHNSHQYDEYEGETAAAPSGGGTGIAVLPDTSGVPMAALGGGVLLLGMGGLLRRLTDW